MNNRNITVIDQTIREGMQYRGLMLSYDERMKILQFQESLGVDISQAAYPPAHESEIAKLKKLCSEAKRQGYNIRVAGLNRSLVDDVRWMTEEDMTDFHLHSAVTEGMLRRRSVDDIFDSLRQTIEFIRESAKDSCIEISILDIGKTDIILLKKCAEFLIDTLKVDILSLPDTSGIMAPNKFYERVKYIADLSKGKETRIGVHCHNDMGMACANTIMGVMAGARVIEAAALGIGERNGIGDIFIVGKSLKDQGYDLNLKTDDIELFRKYYEYVDDICLKKTGVKLLNYNTPFFGDSMKTHVAGTHGIADFGISTEEKYFLNVLCGKSLVKKSLDLYNIEYNKEDLEKIVNEIKNKSVKMERSLTRKEVIEAVRLFHLK